MRGYRKLKLNETMSLATLAAGDVISQAFGGTLNERRVITSLVGLWSLRNLTAGQGPVEVGVAHSDYTAAEIEECLENLGSWDEGDLIAEEQTRRKVRMIGAFSGETTDETLNDGKPIRTKLNWVVASGDTLQVWAWNRDSGTLTTGSQVVLDGHLNSFAR